jgi:hypothetical protein
MLSALSSHSSSTTEPGTRALCVEIGRIVYGLAHDFFDPYRPERHYMRGAGPKWRKKHEDARPMQ